MKKPICPNKHMHYFGLKRLLSLVILLLLITHVFFDGDAYAENKFITVGTGNITGIYYPAGGAICRMVNRDRQANHLRCSVEPTSGALFNLKALISKQLDVAIVQSDLEYEAYLGSKHFASSGQSKNLRSLFSLHDESFTVIARADSNIRNFEDIKGKKINLGTQGSGNRTLMETVMNAYGWKESDFPDLAQLKASEQPEALCSGKIDVMIYTVGHPNGAVQEATTLCPVSILPVTGEVIAKLITEHQAYIHSSIPGGMYIGNNDTIDTFGIKANVVISESMNEDTAYHIVQSIFNNFDYFKKLHPVFSNLDPKKMVHEGMIAPLHKGAERYYHQQGLL